MESTAGKKVFDVKFIKRSYRIRGSVPRIQINLNAIIAISIQNEILLRTPGPIQGVNKATENILIAKILVYSAIKIRANGPLLYSVLKPETNSDSPSAWSKGVRLVSANIVTSQIKNMGRIIKKRGEEKEKEL